MNVDRGLHTALIIGVFSTLFVVLYVTGLLNPNAGLFFPFITGKNFLFHVIVELLLGGWIILAIRNPRFRPRVTPLLISIAVFVGIIALADFFGEYAPKSIWSNFERMEGLVTLVHLLAYFVVVSSVLNTERLWSWFWNTSVVVSIVVGIYGLFQLFGQLQIYQGGVRIDATLGNAIYLALYMLIHFFITAVLLSRWRGAVFVRYLYATAMVFQFAILYFTATRGAMLGILGGVMITAILIAILERDNRRLRKIAGGIVALIIILVGGFFLVRNTNFVTDSPILSRFASISLENVSAQTRLTIWGIAWEGFKEKPILGWGQENFNRVFNKHYEPTLYNQEQWFDRVHNIVLDWLISGGILGLLSYLFISVVFLYLLWRRTLSSTVERSLLTGLLAGYLFSMLFVFDNIVSYMLFFSLLAYVSSNSARNSDVVDESRGLPSGDRNITNHFVIPLVVILTIFTIYAVNYKGLATARTLINALSPQQNNDISLNLAQFQKAFAYDSIGKQEVVEQVMQAVVPTVRAESVDNDTKIEFVSFMKNAVLEQLKEQPGDARLHLFYGSTLSALGIYDEAEEHLQIALSLSPNKPVIYVELAANYMRKEEYQTALGFAKKGYDLEPRFGISRSLTAHLAIRTGDDDLAHSVLLPPEGKHELYYYYDDRVVAAYEVRRDFDQLIRIWKYRIEFKPDERDHYVSLASVYLQVGERQAAIQELLRAIEVDPGYREEGELLINGIRTGSI
jgi:O-antigen ligase/tetratricopeptide (TPR) repeat protein